MHAQLHPASWPTRCIEGLAHIGSMDPAQKGLTHNSTSFEGTGLSVSNCPDAWRQIARLGGQPTWNLTKPGAQFLDVHALTDGHHAQALAWARNAGLLLPARFAEISYSDPEDGQRHAILIPADTPDVDEQVQDELEPREDMDPSLRFTEGHLASVAMNTRLGFRAPPGLVESLALTLYAEAVLASEIGIDGLWWEEALDPNRLSAPRGVIFRGKVQTWAVEQAQSVTRPRRAF